MTLTLYYHPFSSYSWKALLPLYEAGTPFQARITQDAETMADLKAHWPIGRFPLLEVGPDGPVLPEASIIVEYLDRHHPGPERLLPADPDLCLEVRLLDRFFDNYLHGAVQRIVYDRVRPEGQHDSTGVTEAHAQLNTCYAWLDRRMAGREWAVGGGFSLADCAAAPALFYADWLEPNEGRFPHVQAYRARLLARPAMRRIVEEARPVRHLFPGGAPDRD